MVNKSQKTLAVLDLRRIEITSIGLNIFQVTQAGFLSHTTGILTGANMSGDLRDPQKSLPIGTIAAQLTCSLIFLTFVLLYGSTVEGAVLRDKSVS